VANLSWVSADPRNKKLFSFFVHEPRCSRIECNTFSLKKSGKEFVNCCNKVIADLAADSSRAEAEAMLIAAATPIMPVTMAAAAAREGYDGDGRLIRAARRGSTRLGDVSDSDGGLLNGAEELHHTPFIAEDAWTDSPAMDQALGVFRARYLGGVPVKEIEGFRVVQDAARRVKDAAGGGLAEKDVALIITEGQVIVAEHDTGDHMHEHPVSLVSYSLLDPRDRKHFYYIVNDPRLGFAYCHVLLIYSPTDRLGGAMAAAHRAVTRQRTLEAESDNIAGTLATVKTRERTEAKPPLGVYQLRYLGAVRVGADAGNGVVKKAMVDLRTKFREILSLGEEDDWTVVGDRVVLVMTTEGMRVVELATGEVMHFTYIRDISFSTHLHSGYDRKHNPEHDIFAYIATDDRLSRVVCHLFKCPPGVARDITKTAAFAFRICIEEMQRVDQNNPFQATTKSHVDLSSLFPARFILSRRDIKAIKILGAGQFGTVWLALQRLRDGSGTSAHRAVKILRPNAGEQDQEDFLREALTMTELEHEHLVRLIGVSVNHMPWLVVQEFMRFGDLRNVLLACKEKGLALSRLEQLHFMVQLCSGMEYMASKRLVHMDLAARNCLLHDDNLLKIGDFGLTKPFDDGKQHYRLKPNMTVKLPAKWLATECLGSMVFSEASDVWACGVTFWEIVSYGAQPYSRYKNKEMRRVLKGGERLKQPKGCGEDMFNVMSGCWAAEAADRPTFAQLHVTVGQMYEAERQAEGVEPRSIGLLVNDGKTKELPTERENFVETYSSFSRGGGGGGSMMPDDYLDVDGDGNAVRRKGGRGGGQQDGYFEVGDDGQGGGYIDVKRAASAGHDGSYLELGDTDDNGADGGYVQLVREPGDDYISIKRGDEAFTAVSRCNPLFEEAGKNKGG
jgi:hypothetical protein